MRSQYVLAALLLTASLMYGQQELPLLENPVLQTSATNQPNSDRQLENSRTDNCNFNLPAADLTAIAGDTTFRFFTLNGAEEELVCLNCDETEFGTANITTLNRLFYYGTANTIGFDQIDVAICDIGTTDCRDTLSLTIFSRRANRNYFPATELLQQSESIDLEADTSLLEGSLACTQLLDCADNFEGRDQLFYFQSYDFEDYRFTYRSSRFAGVDSVCLVTCDVLGICDTFRYSFRVDVSSLSLPFFEDFSEETTETDPRYWLDREVYINRHMAQQPPSVGVASFDGLDAGGRPYRGGYGLADRLTSTYVDLSGGGAQPVLTFYAQARGLADRPEREDSLIVEFKAANGNWVLQQTIQGLFASTADTTVQAFNFYAIPVPAALQHSRFQFRFSNYADRSGLRDVWHVDYVRLSRTETTQIFSDVAFTDPPTDLLERYTSMPWRHFAAEVDQELEDSIKVGVWNHDIEALNVNPSTFTVREVDTGFDPLDGVITLFNGSDINIPTDSIIRCYQLQGDPVFPSVRNTLVSNLNSAPFASDARLRFRTRYTLSNSSQITNAGYEDVLRNDTVDHITPLQNYFAYDDGTAESAIITGADNRVAVRYRANVADTMRAFRVQLPRLNSNYEGQRFKLQLYLGELDNEPEFEMTLDPVFVSDFRDSLQGFTDYPLQDDSGNFRPIPIPVGDFYVGWQQINNCTAAQCIAFGFDKNNAQSRSEIFVDNGVGWQPLQDFLQGALMIRPVVGSDTPGATPVAELAQPTGLRIYPNPARDYLHIQLTNNDHFNYDVSLYNSAGQLLLQAPLTPTLAVDALPAGMYWLEIRHTRLKESQREKLIIVE